MSIVIEVLSERVYKAGYVLRKEMWDVGNGDEPTLMSSAYNPSGGYIGDGRTAWMLVASRGIHPEKADSRDFVCTIGFSTKDGKWYGWSHRALYGFKVGSTCKVGDVHYTPESDGGRGEWVAESITDAKQMACDFAEGVS